MNEGFEFMFNKAYFDYQYERDSNRVSKHRENIVYYSNERMVKTGLNILDYQEPLLIETLFPEKIQNESNKHESRCE